MSAAVIPFPNRAERAERARGIGPRKNLAELVAAGLAVAMAGQIIAIEVAKIELEMWRAYSIDVLHFIGGEGRK